MLKRVAQLGVLASVGAGLYLIFTYETDAERRAAQEAAKRERDARIVNTVTSALTPETVAQIRERSAQRAAQRAVVQQVLRN